MRFSALQQINAQLNASNQYLTSESAQKNMIIAHLQGQLARSNAEKLENPRTFDMQPDGVIYSIEPSGHRKPVGTMKLEKAEAFTSVVDGKVRNYIKVSYCCGAGLCDTAVIPAEQVVKGILLSYFKVFQKRCSKALANEFLYWMMMKIMNSGNLGLTCYPEFPGMYFQAEDGIITDVDYVCSSGEEDQTIKPYLSAHYLRKTLPFMDKSFSQLYAAVQPYLTGNAVYVLLAFGLAGLLSTYLMVSHYELPVILTVAAQDADGEVLASVFLSTYDRCKPPRSLTMTKTELTKLLRAAKDETVVLIDDTTSESNVKRSSSLDTVLGIRSDEAYKPHNVAILSRTIHHFIPGERALPLELEEGFGKGVQTVQRCKLSQSLAEMYRYLADEFCYCFSSHSQKLNAMIEALKAEEHGFTSESGKATFAVLYGVLLF